MHSLSDLGVPIAMAIASGITTLGVWLLVSADGSSSEVASGLSLVIAGSASIILGLSALARRLRT